ncbi:MAG: pyridoxal phosphate-dependent aminotransferase [Clostridiales bacterium]|uniref:MalY/PatB family protein n=1 Tax=Provencibacterium massiliense TaxID=1841868 RepID=UPI0009A802FF|nr:MalY/PatB family protein [Provencibacterium massiliense]PWM39709.1 MAG: pyridoxal phosphate-dependent aminotransferase [Clostridiales bacterium]RGB65598.1 pyridoxal phosphate-dependent aminotransferase [Harryflintia acetispora]
MKKSDLDRVYDRSGTQCIKWEHLPPDAPEGALPLWVADMDFPCAQPIVDALHERIEQKIFGYTEYDTPACKGAVTGWFRRRFGWEIDPAHIFFSPAVIPAMAYFIDALTAPGDGVLIQRPVYYPFTNIILGGGRRVVNNPLRYRGGAYEMDFGDLERKLADPGTKGMILCSPHNPVGRVWSEEELREVVRLCSRYGRWILADEIHCDLVRREERHHPILKVCPEYADHIVVCTAPTKSFNLAGLQVSNIIIPGAAFQEVWRRQAEARFAISTDNPLGFAAMAAAYNQCEDWLDTVNEYIDDNIRFARKYLEKRLPKAVMVKAQGTYLIWVDLRAYCADSKRLRELMVRRAGVVLDEGDIFGKEGSGFERINAACPRCVLAGCLERMAGALNEGSLLISSS